ncbi:MAG: hypothetical protein ACLP00_19045 [Terracidiphilus sp.]
MIRKMLALCEALSPQDEEWAADKLVATHIAQQAVIAGTVNRHGPVSLTASEITAANVATSGEFSSGAFNCFWSLALRLFKNGDLPGEIAEASRPILKFARGPKAPLVLKLNNVRAELLAAEGGGDPSRVFQRIEEAAQKRPAVSSALFQHKNVELRGSIPLAEIEIFRVVGDPLPYKATLEPYIIDAGPRCPEESVELNRSGAGFIA